MMDELMWEQDLGGMFATLNGDEFFKPDGDEVYRCRKPDGRMGIGWTPKQAMDAAEADMMNWRKR